MQIATIFIIWHASLLPGRAGRTGHGRKDGGQGRLPKAEFGSWMWQAFRLLARLKYLGGAALDVFGYSAERRMEHALAPEYRQMIEGLLAGLAVLRLTIR